MIRTYGNTDTQSIWNGSSSRKYPPNIQQVARRKLRMINSSHDYNDLRIPPANQLEKMKGNLAGHYSIRINNQWRIIFKWKNGDAYEVEIIDYH